MGKIILISGGARSGKSSFALKRANESIFNKKKVFIATALPLDDEMADRIYKHRKERGVEWKTMEVSTELEQVIGTLPSGSVYCLDCLTVWLGNIWFKCSAQEEILVKQCESLVFALVNWKDSIDGEILIVTNEVGSGIIPESPDVRLYRDIAGLLNQMVGKISDEVYFAICGIPMRVK